MLFKSTSLINYLFKKKFKKKKKDINGEARINRTVVKFEKVALFESSMQ